MFGFFLVMPLVIIIAIGNILKRRGFYSDADIAALSKTLYWIILPMLFFRTCYISGEELLTQPNLLISVNICYLATIAVSWAGAAFFVHKGDVRRIAREREDAAYEARLAEAVGRGIADIEAGRYVTSVDEAFARADALRRKSA